MLVCRLAALPLITWPVSQEITEPIQYKTKGQKEPFNDSLILAKQVIKPRFLFSRHYSSVS